MYPRINQLIDELHHRRISTYLVTNAQFPERIQQLRPVTQLYVSIDAPTRDSLKAVDRPLFSDFWDRFLDSLRYAKEECACVCIFCCLYVCSNLSLSLSLSLSYLYPTSQYPPGRVHLFLSILS